MWTSPHPIGNTVLFGPGPRGKQGSGEQQPCPSHLAHPILATAHVPATTAPTKSTQPSPWRDDVPLQLHLSHQGESTNSMSIVAPQSPPTSMRYQAIRPRRLSKPRQKESIG